MGSEIDREADIGAAVQAVQETLDHPPRHEVQVFDRGQELRIGQFADFDWRGGGHGVRTCLRIRRMISSASTFSARA